MNNIGNAAMGNTNSSNTTDTLARYVTDATLNDIPEDVRAESRRALLNFVGCALGGAKHEAMDITLAALSAYSGGGEAQALGRPEKISPSLAALLNGISSHVEDYDDTTPNNYIHATSPVAAALFAHASVQKITGADLELALILGFEVISRIGNATYPAHYDAGWHSTGSIGVFGSAASIGRVLGLSHQQMVWALALGGTQSAGVREMFGSMAKSFHPGRSAQSGYAAALLARQGFTAGEQILEGPRGFAAVQAGTYDLSIVTKELGTQFALRGNTYKPFPCGLVIHPIIDACIQVRSEHAFDPLAIDKVKLYVAPRVKDLCDKKLVTTGLEGKFSAYHGAAIGLIRGKGGLAEFTDEAAVDPALVRVRERTEVIVDETVTPDGVHVEVCFNDGQSYTKTLEHSIGNLAKPLSNSQLEGKFREQAAVLGISTASTDQLIDACWNIEQVPDISHLISLATPHKKA